jgi:hypothetical protein
MELVRCLSRRHALAFTVLEYCESTSFMNTHPSPRASPSRLSESVWINTCYKSYSVFLYSMYKRPPYYNL